MFLASTLGFAAGAFTVGDWIVLLFVVPWDLVTFED
jgi:hypothetical protein